MSPFIYRNQQGLKHKISISTNHLLYQSKIPISLLIMIKLIPFIQTFKKLYHKLLLMKLTIFVIGE